MKKPKITIWIRFKSALLRRDVALDLGQREGSSFGTLLDGEEVSAKACCRGRTRSATTEEVGNFFSGEGETTDKFSIEFDRSFDKELTLRLGDWIDPKNVGFSSLDNLRVALKAVEGKIVPAGEVPVGARRKCSTA